MRLFLRVLLPKRHGSERDFANVEVRVTELSVLQWAVPLLCVDGQQSGASPEVEGERQRFWLKNGDWREER